MVIDEPFRIVRRVSMIAMGMAMFLVAAKVVAWGVSGSASVFASMLDSLMDAVLSLGNVLAAGYAAKPADDDHRFGHHSIEDIMGLLQGAFVGGVAVFALIQGLQQLMNPMPLHNDKWAILVMCVSILSTLGLVAYQRLMMKKTHSVLLKADHAHYLSDLLTNAGVIVAVVVAAYTDFIGVDGLIGTIIAVYVLWHVFLHVVRPAYHRLMDRALSQQQEEEIARHITSHDGVLGYHGLKTRASGSKIFIQVHLDLNGNQTLFQAHSVADSLEDKLKKIYPNADIMIHQDPVA